MVGLLSACIADISHPILSKIFSYLPYTRCFLIFTVCLCLNPMLQLQDFVHLRSFSEKKNFNFLGTQLSYISWFCFVVHVTNWQWNVNVLPGPGSQYSPDCTGMYMDGQHMMRAAGKYNISAWHNWESSSNLISLGTEKQYTRIKLFALVIRRTVLRITLA